MEERKGFTPLGIDEDYYKVSTTSTIPVYETPHLGLTQYTPNRITSWLNNYNEDMRKIDKNSSSIASGILKILDDSAAEHQRLQREIDNTNSVMAFNEKRIDNVEDAILDLQGDIADARLYTDQEITRSEAEMTKKLNDAMKATASSIAYVQHEVDRNNFVTSTSIARMEQRLHVAEDELVDIRKDMGAETADVAALKNDMSNVKTRLTDAEDDIADTMADVADLQTANTALGGRVASLEATEVVQNSTINSLNNQVASMQNIGDDVNALKQKSDLIAYLTSTGNLGSGSFQVQMTNRDSNRAEISVAIQASTAIPDRAKIIQPKITLLNIAAWLSKIITSYGEKVFYIIINFETPDTMNEKYITVLTSDETSPIILMFSDELIGFKTQIKMNIRFTTNAKGFATPVGVRIIGNYDSNVKWSSDMNAIIYEQ